MMETVEYKNSSAASAFANHLVKTLQDVILQSRFSKSEDVAIRVGCTFIGAVFGFLLGIFKETFEARITKRFWELYDSVAACCSQWRCCGKLCCGLWKKQSDNIPGETIELDPQPRSNSPAHIYSPSESDDEDFHAAGPPVRTPVALPDNRQQTTRVPRFLGGPLTNDAEIGITSIPGLDGCYLGKPAGILKLVQLILSAVAFGLFLFHMVNDGFLGNETASRYNATHMGKEMNTLRMAIENRSLSSLRQTCLVGDVFFLCIHFAVMTVLGIFLITFMLHSISAIIVSKATSLETVLNLLLASLLISAGIVEIVITEKWTYDHDNTIRPNMYSDSCPGRLAAGVIAVVNGLMFLVGLTMAKKELDERPSKTCRRFLEVL